MKVLVWHWGRYGYGPRAATGFAEAFARAPGVEVALSLSRGAEMMRGADAPRCAMPVRTYETVAGFASRFASAPVLVPRLAARVRGIAPDFAVCAMPAPLDLLMAEALRRAGVPFAVVVHDADRHPGDGYPFQMTLQRALVRRADAVVALTEHVAARLRALRPGRRPPVLASLPAVPFGAIPGGAPRAHGGVLRLLSFGRLLAYKGLDLLADSLRRLDGRVAFEMRVVGSGPEGAALAALRAIPGVRVENRWVPESEVGALLAWSDALVLSHREASQSGVAAAALAAGRWVVATRVGGLGEQLRGQPAARLCDPDAASLASAIERLARDPPEVSLGAPAWEADARRLVIELGETLVPAACPRPRPEVVLRTVPV